MKRLIGILFLILLIISAGKERSVANQDIMQLAAMINGEGASLDRDAKIMIGSSALNRLEAKRAEEFGSNLQEVLSKGYYAVSNPNTPYKQAISQQFPDKVSENSFKESLVIASGLIGGTIPKRSGMFYFTDKEINKFKKNPKLFNLKAVKEIDKVGNYRVFSY